jgi:hypothetical protein
MKFGDCFVYNLDAFFIGQLTRILCFLSHLHGSTGDLQFFFSNFSIFSVSYLLHLYLSTCSLRLMDENVFDVFHHSRI